MSKFTQSEKKDVHFQIIQLLKGHLTDFKHEDQFTHHKEYSATHPVEQLYNDLYCSAGSCSQCEKNIRDICAWAFAAFTFSSDGLTTQVGSER